MLQTGTDPESYITEYTSEYEDYSREGSALSPFEIRCVDHTRPYVGVLHFIRRPNQIYYALSNLLSEKLTNGSKNGVTAPRTGWE